MLGIGRPYISKIPGVFAACYPLLISLVTRPEVSEADPGNQNVTKSKVSKLRPAHRNSKVNI